jgi:tRNA(Ile)-lysidine synthase
LLEKVKNWCEREKLFQAGDAILIACSGGPDSLALVHLFLDLRKTYELQISVGHVDHMFRGAESKADADFVRTFCKHNHLPFYLKTADVPAFAKEKSLSAEEAARIVRYDFLRNLAEKLGGAMIATAHHLDDQAETILLHLFRGAGSQGIAGIRPKSCGIIRPFLSVTRQEIERYCKEKNLTPRIDATNNEPEHLRNKIRLELMPVLKKTYNPVMPAALCRSAELIGAEHDFINVSAKMFWQDIVSETDEKLVLNRQRLQDLHIALQRELFRLAIMKTAGDLNGLGFLHIEQMISLVKTGKTGTILELPKQLVLVCDYNTVELCHKSALQQPVKQDVFQVLPVSGFISVPLLQLTVQVERINEYVKPTDLYSVVCDMDRLNGELFIRLRRPGDRFQPSGMNGFKKLKDFFIDNKVARVDRDRIPLFCDQNTIFWVGGLRQNQTSQISGQTKHFLRFTILKDR